MKRMINDSLLDIDNPKPKHIMSYSIFINSRQMKNDTMSPNFRDIKMPMLINKLQ